MESQKCPSLYIPKLLLQAYEADYRPLARFLDSELGLRKHIAVQIIQLIDTFVQEDPNWVLFQDQFSVDSFVVARSGSVVLHDFNRVMMVDRDLLDEEDVRYGK